MERRSRRSISSMMVSADSARSRHSATLRRGRSCSAICTRPSAGTFSRPSATAFLFCSSTAARTAGTPPIRTFSAIVRCASGSSARTASTFTRRGLMRFGFGRCGNSGGVSKNGRRGRSPRPSAPSRRSPRGLSPSRRSPRGLSPSRRGPRRLSPSRAPFLRSCCVTASKGFSEGRISRSPVRAAFCFGAVIERTRVPSRSDSTSARTTSFTAVPAGTTESATTPLG